MVRRAAVGCLLVVLGLGLPCFLHAAPLDLSLNLIYSDPGDPMSEGTWQLAAKADPNTYFGISLVVAHLTGIVTNSAQAAGPTGTVNGGDDAGFSVFQRFISSPGVTEIALSQHPLSEEEVAGGEQTIFYGVGTLEEGEPGQIGPAFTTLVPSNIQWATEEPDFLNEEAWLTAAILATGPFNAGSTPGFSGLQRGQLYSSLPPNSQEVGNLVSVRSDQGTVSFIVRDNLTSGFFGDYNEDGKVSAADFTVWRDSIGAATLPNRDPGNSGPIGTDDFESWKENYGSGLGAGAGGSASLLGAIPEPSGGFLALLGMLFSPYFRVWNRTPRFQLKIS